MRFVGELYNRNILAEGIMHHIVRCSLRMVNKDPEALESLCTLLTVIGKKFENDKMNAGVSNYYVQLKALAQNQQLAYRYRSMTLDLLALRTNGWEPRIRDDERRNGQWNYSREFMRAVAELPVANVRPQFDTTEWSAVDLRNVFELGKVQVVGSLPQWMLDGMGTVNMMEFLEQVFDELGVSSGSEDDVESDSEGATLGSALLSRTAATSAIGDQGTTTGSNLEPQAEVHMVVSSGTRDCTMQTDPIDEREQIVRLLHKNPELVDFVKTYIRAVEN